MFVETIKVLNGCFYNLEYHEKRARETAMACFGRRLSWDTASMVVPEEARVGLVKCRVVYDTGIREVTFQPYVMRKIGSLRLVDGGNIDYRYKATDRSALTALLDQRAGCDDILIVRDGRITDTSFSNVVFEDAGGGLYTPDTCLLKGTRRESLLDAGIIRECPITVDDIRRFRKVLLVNAMIGLEDGVGVLTGKII
ncbi:aminotransferase class IV [Odoribacter sp. AF15-53]|uniref:aminotransferase class IV n=1 Tax=Odoribacter sp. AF15-53 TaxID=2292236 RepID=UPI00131423CA|nr:aminotransferase class IV [Odoribacter sp. AF15-53]